MRRDPQPTATRHAFHFVIAAISVNLEIRAIGAAEQLAFMQRQSSASFLQTPAWGRVKTEWRSECLGWFAAGQLVGAALVLHRPVPHLQRFTLAYLPQGPVIDWSGNLADWLDPLAEYLADQGAFAVRLSPPVRTHTWSAAEVKAGIAACDVKRLTDLPGNPASGGAHVTAELRAAGWLPQSPRDGFGAGQPQYTFELPLAGKSEDDLLGGMNQLWRRNIKKAARAGVEVHHTGRPSAAELAAFHRLYLHTAERDQFRGRPLRYFETMFAAMAAESPERIGLNLARHDGDLVAATLTARLGPTTWYTYGASSTAKREVRGSNACQWAMIRQALAGGCDRYDLRGITATLDPADPHVGLIQFKVGTGGQAVRYVGEWDLPLRPVIYRAFATYLHRRGR